MKLFRAKPVTVEAEQYDGENAIVVSEFSEGLFQGCAHMEPGDWIIRDGENYYFMTDEWVQSHYEPLVA
jgi:hypothetical protein